MVESIQNRGFFIAELVFMRNTGQYPNSVKEEQVIIKHVTLENTT